MKNLLLITLVSTLPLIAQADNLPTPAGAPPSLTTECGSCHLVFSPKLLVANDWQRIMSNLDKHYGDNASLDDKTRQEIEAFLIKQASTKKTPSDSRELPRITQSPSFVRRHHEVPASAWKDPKLGSAANCAGCHQRAEEGRFGERELVMPNGKKWED